MTLTIHRTGLLRIIAKPMLAITDTVPSSKSMLLRSAAMSNRRFGALESLDFAYQGKAGSHAWA